MPMPIFECMLLKMKQSVEREPPIDTAGRVAVGYLSESYCQQGLDKSQEIPGLVSSSGFSRHH